MNEDILLGLVRVLAAPIIISVLVYCATRWLKHSWLRGSLLAGLAFLLVFAVQDLQELSERYKLDRVVMEEAGHPWVRIPFYMCNLGLNPLMWGSPLIAASLVMPESFSSSRFRYVTYQLGQPPNVLLVEPDCDKHTLKHNTGEMSGMAPGEIKVFCSDWTKERQALKDNETGKLQKTRARSPCSNLPR